MNQMEYIMAIDYGAKRVGVALAHSVARLPRPLVTLANNDHLIEAIQELMVREQVGSVVVGLPRGMDGGHTEQTRLSEAFAVEFRSHIDQPVYLVDETLTSVEADKRPASQAGLDADAAAIILERYLSESSYEVVK